MEGTNFTGLHSLHIMTAPDRVERGSTDVAMLDEVRNKMNSSPVLSAIGTNADPTIGAKSSGAKLEITPERRIEIKGKLAELGKKLTDETTPEELLQSLKDAFGFDETENADKSKYAVNMIADEAHTLRLANSKIEKNYPELWSKSAKVASATDAASAHVASVPTSKSGSLAGGASSKVVDSSVGKGTTAEVNKQEDGGKDVRYRGGAEGDGVRQRNANVSSEEKESAEIVKEHLAELSKNLRTNIFVADNYAALSKEQQKMVDEAHAKGKSVPGWYDTRDGKVVIYLPDVRNRAEAEKTILHEVVAHKGLRSILGEDFDKICRLVYNGLDAKTRQQFVEKYGDDANVIGDEYMAAIAEDDVVEPSMWNKIKSRTKQLLRKAGFDVNVSDNEIVCFFGKARNV